MLEGKSGMNTPGQNSEGSTVRGIDKEKYETLTKYDLYKFHGSNLWKKDEND